jgi:hypothetical protein
MPAWSLALRVLLSLCLLVNGTASAMMHAAPSAESAPQAAAEQALAETMPPCHDTGTTQTDMAPDPAAPAHDPSAPDCCASGACRCASVHFAPLVPAFMLGAVERGDERGAQRVRRGHASPVLAHPIRPPIG